MKYGFIGAGNLASAVIGGMLSSGQYTKEEIVIFDVGAEVKQNYAANGFQTADSVEALESLCDAVFLTVKPHIYSKVLSALKGNKMYISVAPGITINEIQTGIGCDAKVVRTMPNTPAKVSAAMTVMCHSGNMSQEELQAVQAVFQSIGKVRMLEEKLMNASVAVSGSSPAYVYMMIEAMADGAVMQGIDRKTAYELAAQAVYGAAKMVLETGEHPGVLKDQVCSPGGTTIAAVYELEKAGFRSALISAMEKCYDRIQK